MLASDSSTPVCPTFPLVGPLHQIRVYQSVKLVLRDAFCVIHQQRSVAKISCPVFTSCYLLEKSGMNGFRTPTRPASPVKVSWFEFLLNPSLLEQYLAQDNPDPGPVDLIISFLSNCTASATPEANNNGNKAVPSSIPNEDGEGNVEESKEQPESKKSQALKLLALKVGAHLKWDVNLFEKKLPITMQQTLLKELLKIAGNDVKSNGEVYSESMKQNPNSDFAFILYYTWVLRAVVEGSYPSKVSRTSNVQIPGQIDPTVVPPAVVENIMRKLQEETSSATEALEQWLQSPSKVRMPTLNCFGSITDENPMPIHHWDQGVLLEEEEIVCQVSYALGRFYFFQENYEKASKHFNRASDLLQKLKNPVFCFVNEPKLKGFYNACAHLLGYQKSDASTPLKESLQTSVKAGHLDTVKILRSDNLKRELPLALRHAVEVNVLQEHSSKQDMLLYVLFCNALRCTVDGQVILSDWVTLLKSNEEKSSLILCELLKDVIPTCSQLQKSFLRNFVRMLCLVSMPAKVLLRKFEVLSSLLPNQEIEELFALGQSAAKREALKMDKSFTDDPSVWVSVLERKLLSATDPLSVKHLVSQLRTNFGRRNIGLLNQKWEMPRSGFMLLKGVPQTEQEVIQIFLAKANELCAVKSYGESRQLLRSVESEIYNYCPRMSRYINWELLKLDLLEILDAPVYSCQPSPYRAEVVQRILAFKPSCKDRDLPPDSNLPELCAAVLLNFREWDKILELGPGLGSYFEFSQAVAAVCRDVFLNKGNRSAGRDLWEMILPIFSNAAAPPSSHKRTSSGVIKDVPREYNHAVMNKYALQIFIRKLKDTSSLGVIISCLAKLYNILKDDSMGEIFLEYQGLWPSSVPNAALFNISAICDAFQATLQHALSFHPTHSAWLRTKGDVMYVQGHYSSALKYYLSAAMVSTDYFYLPLPKVLFDDLMFKHMIHCCTKLHNHTQAAVLHQFLEDANYPMAFKALGERVCNDSCDAYYPCIWDVTLLEFLINLHSRRGDLSYRQLVMHLIGQLELNANNNEEIQREAANLRKGRFLRAMAKQFL